MYIYKYIVCMCVCTRACVGVATHVCACGDQKPVSGTFLTQFPPYFVRQGLSLTLSLTD